MRKKLTVAARAAGFIAIVLGVWLASLQGGHLTASAATGSPMVAQTLPTPTDPVCKTKPAAPASVTAEPGDSSATITWDDVTPPGICTISDYQIGSTPATTTQTGNSPFTFPGLVNCTSYTFHVAAIDELGAGPSRTSNAVIPHHGSETLPSTPGRLRVIGLDGSARIAWDPSASPGGCPLQTYTVRAYSNGVVAATAAFSQAPSAGSWVTFPGLANGTIYDFTVSAKNAFGEAETAHSRRVMPGPLVAVLPAMANQAYGGFTTAANLQNVGSGATIPNIVYSNDTGLVGDGDTVDSIPANGMAVVRQDNGSSFSAGGAGSALVYSGQPLAVFVNEFGATGSDATSYTGIKPSGTGTNLYIPAIANNAYGGYTTGIGLLSISGSGDITVTYRDNNGLATKTEVLSAVPSSSYVALYSGAAGLPNGWAGTATISSPTRQLAAVVNEVGPHSQLSSFDAVTAGSTTLFAPAALNNAYGGFYTGMGIQNTAATAGTVTVDYYDALGAKTEIAQSIAAGGYLGLYQGGANGPPPSASGYTAVLTSTVPVAAIVNEVAPPAASPTMSTSYNTFPAGAARANLPLVENAGPDGWSTGLGVMNTGTTSTTVTLAYYDAATGNPVGSWQTQTIAPKAFYGPYQPNAGLPPGIRATAVLTTTSGGQVAVIANELGANAFMSYDGQ